MPEDDITLKVWASELSQMKEMAFIWKSLSEIAEVENLHVLANA